MRINQEDETVMGELQDASKELNDSGCKAFYKTINAVLKKHLKVVDEGVLEFFTLRADFTAEDDSDDLLDELMDEVTKEERKVYETTEKSCNCTRWIQDGYPCRQGFVWNYDTDPITGVNILSNECPFGDGKN